MAENKDTIRSILIKRLFGQYTYTLPGHGSFSDAAILYGDNGAGKSTILKLVFHLLSSANNRGHRTALTEVPYQLLEVTLNSGVTLTASRTGSSISGSKIYLTIRQKDNLVAEWYYDSDRPSHSIDAARYHYLVERQVRGLEIKGFSPENEESLEDGQTNYIQAISRLAPNMFYLSADRRLESDTLKEGSEETEGRFLLHLDEHRKVDDVIARSRETALTNALNKGAAWIRQKAFQGANLGSTNVHSVYTNVIKHITTARSPNEIERKPIDSNELRARLNEIAITTENLAKYELTIPVDLREFRKSLSSGPPSRRELVAGVLSPYAESLEGRIRALLPLFDIVNRFVTTINAFFSNKFISFTLSKGFEITNSIGEKLEPRMLSSGEQQLLLLFCNTLTGRDKPSVFIIDEPEISLNVKWQRILVQSLLRVTEGALIQFIFASHSIEMISQHSKRVVHLNQAQ